MDNQIKRRLFLSGIVGTLIGAPVAVCMLGGKRGSAESHLFAKTLKKYRSMADVPVVPIRGASSFKLTLTPPVGNESRYVLYSPASFPNEFSVATGNDPDAFFVREGTFTVDRNDRDQVLITGGDLVAGVFFPTGNEDKELKGITAYMKDGRLRSGKVKGTETPLNHDLHMPHLLALNPPASLSNGQLAIGMKWKGNTGRVKPYTGIATRYEMLGFAEVGGRKTARIGFEGSIPNMAGKPGFYDPKPGKNAVSTSKHRGDCYFDVETGLLVRQETEMESFHSGIKGFKAKDGSDSIMLNAQFIVQIFNV